MTPERIGPQGETQPKFYKTPEGGVPRDTILERAALILCDDPQYPDSRGEAANILLAKRAIRQALREKGLNVYSNIEDQISNDAREVVSRLV